MNTIVLAIAANGWKINNVLNNTTNNLRSWGGLVMVIVGVVMCIVGIFKIAQALISHGKTQANWVINIMLILVGALFCIGGAFFDKLTSSGNDSVGGALQSEIESLGADTETE